jgi:hypothetical protein
MNDKKPRIRKGLSLSISGIDKLIKSEFIDLALSKNITQAQFLAVLLNNYKNFYIPLNQEEQEIMGKAYRIAPNTLKKKIKNGALRHASNLVNTQRTVKNVVDTNAKNSPRAADARADALLEQIFKHNEAATNWYDKIFITKTALLDRCQEQKELNPESVSIGKAVLDRCLERCRVLIENHHKEHKLESKHNTRAYYERLKIKNLKNQKTEKR